MVFCRAVGLAALIVMGLSASPQAVGYDSSETKTKVSGYGAIEVGQIVKGRYQYLLSSEMTKVWIGHVYAGLSAARTVNDHFSVRVALESRIWYNTSPMFLVTDAALSGYPLQNFDIRIPYAQGVLSFGGKGRSAFTLGFGRFQYKYNPQAQDLGEYLFRSGCYPAYIKTDFDLPFAYINGLSLSHTFSDFLRQELLLTTMDDVRPYLDINLAYLANVTFGKTFEIGAGVAFDHLFSVDSNETNNSYTSNGYIKANGDTAFYTFAGTKLMARFMFDPKRLFNVSFFGEQDGIIYAEAAILGLKNYPSSTLYDSTNAYSNKYGYDKLTEKMPIMMGCNIPTLRLLDVLSLEFEWFGSRYKDSYESNMGRKPAPSLPVNIETDADFLNDNWKWAVYAKKTIYGGLSFIGLIGRDHLRAETFLGPYKDYQATLVKQEHWYWMMKIKYSF